MKYVKIAPEAVRGYWLTDLGQRVEEWIPAGLYETNDHAESRAGIPIVALVSRNGRAWHIPAALLPKLPRQ